MRKLLSLLAVFVVSLLALSMVSASFVPGELEVTSVDINDEDADLLTAAEVGVVNWTIDGFTGFPVSSIEVEEGETLEIAVRLRSTGDAEDVQVEAELRGYEYNDYDKLEDESHVFDLLGTALGPNTKTVRLSIDLPKQLEDDRYLLRVRVTDRDHADLTRYVVLQVVPVRHGLDIADVAFSPGNTVKAGRSLLASVLLENFGDRDQEDVKVTVAIPELGVSATEYVDEVNNNDNNVDYEDVAEMFLPIPADAAEGDYEVRVTVWYDDLRETVTKSYTLRVTANEMFQGSYRLVLAVGPETQTVGAGQTAMYGVALTNAGVQSKAYVLSVTTGDWAVATLSDSLVVLEPGQNKVVYVNLVTSENTVPGEHLASLAISSGDDVLETVVLTANVVEGNFSGEDLSLRSGLEIALIVLVVLLVVIGLIIGFSRLRKDEGEEQAYY